MKRLRIIIVAMVILLGLGFVAFFVAFIIGIRQEIHSRTGPEYRFAAGPGELFLTDDRAVEVAREVMKRDGFAMSDWKIAEDDRSKSPDGKPDRYLVRNGIDANGGSVLFRSVKSDGFERIVDLELHGGEIRATETLGK